LKLFENVTAVQCFNHSVVFRIQPAVWSHPIWQYCTAVCRL